VRPGENKQARHIRSQRAGVGARAGLYTGGLFEEGPMVTDIELNRLYWHSRRGMLELDVLLVPFVKEVYPSLNETDRAVYVRLLTCEDQDMFGWFMERNESPDPELQRMVRMILDRVQPK
jgi:antitoxin CptB